MINLDDGAAWILGALIILGFFSFIGGIIYLISHISIGWN